MQKPMKLQRTENGNCRVYYRDDARRLVCFQETFRGRFELLACSSDGEPSHPIAHEDVVLDKLPADDCATSRAFIAWWKESSKV